MVTRTCENHGMSDFRLRDLERRWRSTGSIEDEAEYLRECVRTGHLAQEMLELAAYCGHAASLRLCGGAPPDSWSDWAGGLVKWGPDMCARAAITGIRAEHATTSVESPTTARKIGVYALAAAGKKWLECPCRENEGDGLSRVLWEDPIRVLRSCDPAVVRRSVEEHLIFTALLRTRRSSSP